MQNINARDDNSSVIDSEGYVLRKSFLYTYLAIRDTYYTLLLAVWLIWQREK